MANIRLDEIPPENGETGRLKESPRRWKVLAFGLLWVLTTLLAGWQMANPSFTFESASTLLVIGALLACSVALMLLVGNPVRDLPAAQQLEASRGTQDNIAVARPKTSRFVFIILAAGVVLFSLRTLVGPPLLFGLPVLAVITLVVLRQPLPRGEVFYASGLALLAGLAGLAAGWITDFAPVLWSILQVALTLSSFLAGWAILRRTGLTGMGVGRIRLLQEGPASAARGFLLGILLAVPWALGNVVMGGANPDAWVKSWWQPFVAIQPGIAEEAWGRIFLVPFLFLLFRLFNRPRAAFLAALFVMGYWFAYLHTPGDLGSAFSTLVIGTLYALPISYLCLFKDLETAVGFHFWVDFIRYGAALILLKP